MTLGQRIYTYRTQKQLSQATLAELLEVSRQSVSKWETDASVPELDKLIKMGELFEISLDELIKGDKPPYMTEKEAVSQETSALSHTAASGAETKPAPTAVPKTLSWQKIAIIILLACGMFSPFIGTIFSPFIGVWISRILAVGLFILTLLLAILLYLVTKSYGLLICSWVLWLLFYGYLRYAIGIRFWWIVLPWIYINGLLIYALIAWIETLTLAVLIFCTAQIWYQKYKKLKIEA